MSLPVLWCWSWPEESRKGCPVGDPSAAEVGGGHSVGSWRKRRRRNSCATANMIQCQQKHHSFFPRSSRHFVNINSGGQVVMEQILLYRTLKLTIAFKVIRKGILLIISLFLKYLLSTYYVPSTGT